MDYTTYLAYRSGGATALEAYNKGKHGERRPLLDGLISTVIGVMAYVLAGELVGNILGWAGDLWVISPTGKTKIALPLYTALRVIRKRGWDFCPVEPTKHIRAITRKEALKVLLLRTRIMTVEQRGLA